MGPHQIYVEWSTENMYMVRMALGELKFLNNSLKVYTDSNSLNFWSVWKYKFSKDWKKIQ